MKTTFTPENFKKVFKPYRVKFTIAYLIVMCPVLIFLFCAIVPPWQQWLMSSVFMETGPISERSVFRYGMFAIGLNHAHIIGIGLNVAGVFAVGVNTCGIVAIGTNAVGVIAIGVNTLGVITIDLGGFGYGIYALSRTHRYKGKYLFAPHRQDPKAVALFTRWLPGLAESGCQDSNDNIQ